MLASTLTATEKKSHSVSLFLPVSLSLRMHYRDDDPSGTAPKTTLYETEPGMSVESAMAVSTRLISVVSPLCFARQELARFRNAAILESMLSDSWLCPPV